MSDRLPFWSDDFDLDLLKVVPDAAEILAETADIKLWTPGSTTHGRLNHPSVWNGGPGFIAFFGTSPVGAVAQGFSYDHRNPLVECTFLEAVRSAWVQHFLILVNRQTIWGGSTGLRNDFQDALYLVRKWLTPDRDLVAVQNSVRRSLVTAYVAMLGHVPVTTS